MTWWSTLVGMVIWHWQQFLLSADFVKHLYFSGYFISFQSFVMQIKYDDGECFKCTVFNSATGNWNKFTIYMKAGLDGRQWNIDEITNLPSLRKLPMYHSQSKYQIIT